jgi:hypothetical protein
VHNPQTNLHGRTTDYYDDIDIELLDPFSAFGSGGEGSVIYTCKLKDC